MTEDELNKIFAELMDETSCYPGDDTSDRECANTMAYISGIKEMYRKCLAHITGKQPESKKDILNSFVDALSKASE